MGIDEGFDLYPPLEDNESDNEKWADFLSHVVSHYQDKGDSNMTLDRNGDIVFTQGEHPTLLKRGYRFRRFSSKISGRHAGNVEKYLKEVRNIARMHFGWERVKWWSELADELGLYDWTEVYAARDGKLDMI